MWDLFNVNDAKGLNVFEVENGIVDMTQTGDSFDRWAIDIEPLFPFVVVMGTFSKFAAERVMCTE